MTHTPGPLTLHHSGYELDVEERIKAGTEIIATVHHLGRGREAEQHANAELFAAAPDLLTALETYQTVLAELQQTGFSSTAIAAWTRLGHADTRAQLAIAKAKGAL